MCVWTEDFGGRSRSRKSPVAGRAFPYLRGILNDLIGETAAREDGRESPSAGAGYHRQKSQTTAENGQESPMHGAETNADKATNKQNPRERERNVFGRQNNQPHT